MGVKILPSSEVRDRIASILKELSRDKEPIFITQYSRAKAVLVGIDQYNALMDLIEDLEDIADFRTAEGESVKDFEEFMAGLEGKSSVSA
ncbi:MAG: type II toxin-antitoxin system Phd/YefM family antitoxin [Actinomycetota bacterium]|nr:type II toxin-antitoxin system Phd/YefM family antitoxin [Actinomycetota bacterium]